MRQVFQKITSLWLIAICALTLHAQKRKPHSTPVDLVRQVRMEQLQLLRNAQNVDASSGQPLPVRQQTEVNAVLAALDEITESQTVTFSTASEIVVSLQHDGVFIATIVRPDRVIAAAATGESAEKALELAKTAVTKCTESGGTAQIVEANGYIHEGVAIALAPLAESAKRDRTRNRS